MSELTRQHYRLAMNEPLNKTPGGPTPGYKKGGKVMAKMKRMGVQKGGAMYRKGSGRGC
jgi:hypothetical protein